MKRKFLLISMCAAVMFFSSCSKEDNGSVDTKEVNNQTEVNATKAITVSAKQKSSVSKVALGNENQGKYEEVFSEGEVLTLYLNNEVITTLELTDGAGKTSATFSGEIPLSADGKTISAKILPKDSPSGLTECSSFATAVSNYASLYGTFTYNASDENFAVTLDDEVSYFVVETNKFSEVDINGNDYTVSNNSVVFAFKENQTVSSTKLELNSVALTAGGNVYFKTLNVVTGISLNKTSTVISAGGKETLTATILPANATNNSVTWTSSNTDVATVNENGEVTAVASGTAIITATANDGSGVYRECYVRVESNASATSISDLDHLYESGKYILQNDIEVDYFYTVPNTNIDIDLNGHTITVSTGIMVNNATLTLRGSGTIIGCEKLGVSLEENSVLNLYDNVTINSMTGVEMHRNSVLNICDNVTISRVHAPDGKVNMYGGYIEYIYVDEDDAVFNYQGGQIENGW